MEMNYDPLYPDCPVADQYLKIWSNHGTFHHKPAFAWVDRCCKITNILTYGQLNTLTQATSSWLCDHPKLHQGDRVILIYPPGLDFISVFFACQRSGIVVIPLMPPSASKTNNKSSKSMQEIILECSPTAFLVSSMCDEPEIKHLAEYFNLPWIVLDPIHDSRSTENNRETKAGDLYLIQYTSGSTGPPKPVMISAGAAAHNARAARRAYDLSPSSIIVSWLPQYHDCGLMFIVLSITCGATLFLASPFEFAARPWLWMEMLSTFKATSTVVPGFALPLLTRNSFRHLKEGAHERLQLSNLRNLILINEPVVATDVNRFVQVFSEFGLRRESVAPSYGLAENCTFVSTAWSEESSAARNEKTYPEYCGLMPSGRISRTPKYVQEMDIRIVDPQTHEELADGEEGEVWISSPSMGMGYVDDAELSKKIFKSSSSRFLRTDDTGVVKNGYLFVTGRVSDQIVIENRRIHPHFLEYTAFCSSPLLRPGCTVAFHTRNRGRKDLILVGELGQDRISNTDANVVTTRIFLDLLRKHEAVVQIVVLVRPRSVPKTSSGKLRRSETRRMYEAGELPSIACVSFKDVLSHTNAFPPLEIRSLL